MNHAVQCSAVIEGADGRRPPVRAKRKLVGFGPGVTFSGAAGGDIAVAAHQHFRPLTEVTTGRYLPPEEFEGEEEDLEDAALLIDERHILSIEEVVRQTVWLAMPMYPGCNWTGGGDCPNLIKRLSELDQLEDIGFVNDPRRATAEEIDPRWAALLKLRNEAESQES